MGAGSSKLTFDEDTLGEFKNATGYNVHRKMAALEIMCGIEAKNQYAYKCSNKAPKHTPDGVELEFVKNDVKANMLAWEESACLERICCLQNRSLKILVAPGIDRDHDNVIASMVKPFSCVQCCCLKSNLTMYLGNEKDVVNRAKVDGSNCFANCCQTKFSASNPAGDKLVQTEAKCWLNGNFCCPCCCGDFAIPVVDTSGAKVATIWRKQMGCMEVLTKQNHMTVVYEEGVKVSLENKAAILSMANLIEMEIYFAQNGN